MTRDRRAQHIRYNHSAQGIARRDRYNHGPVAKATRKRYISKPEVLAHFAWLHRSQRLTRKIRENKL